MILSDGAPYYLREDGTHVSVDHMGSVGPVADPVDFQEAIKAHLLKQGLDEVVIDVTNMPVSDVRQYRTFAQEQVSTLSGQGQSTPQITWIDI